MNILPHKSWNVYNKKNIEKVRRDEAKAKEEEQAKAGRATHAESEARLNLLRERAQKKQQLLQSTTTSESTLVPQPTIAPSQHINLFEEEAKEHAQNEEHLAEQKAKDDKWERQITMYLDKGTDKESTPWYAIQEHDRFGESSKESKKRKNDDTKEERKHKRRWRDPIKLNEDPLVEIKTSLSKREEKHKERYHESKKKHKKEKKSSSKASSSSSIEALRAQRLERERKERARAKSYVYGEVEDTKPLLEDRHHYSSQFNPTETAEARKRRRDRHNH